jgi:hypothetical protein
VGTNCGYQLGLTGFRACRLSELSALGTVFGAATIATMSDLGDLLEALHTSLTSYERVRVEYRTWMSSSGAGLAMARQAGQAPPQTRGSGSMPDEFTRTQRIWIDRDRSRVEEVEMSSVAIRDGMRWWTYHPQMGAIAGEDSASSHNKMPDPPGECCDLLA